MKLKSSGLELKKLENMPSGIVPKAPKPGYVSFGAIKVGYFGILCSGAAVYNLFDLGRHLVRADHYWNLRTSAFTEWERAVAENRVQIMAFCKS